jgi:hypothetical protein
VVFRDFWNFHADHNAMLVVVGVVLCFSGVFVITRRPKVYRPAGAHVSQQQQQLAPPAVAISVEAAGAAGDGTPPARNAAREGEGEGEANGGGGPQSPGSPGSPGSLGSLGEVSSISHGGGGGGGEGGGGARERFPRALSYIGRSISQQLDTAVVGDAEAAAEQVHQRVINPPVGVVTGSGTLVQLYHLASSASSNSGSSSASLLCAPSQGLYATASSSRNASRAPSRPGSSLASLESGLLEGQGAEPHRGPSAAVEGGAAAGGAASGLAPLCSGDGGAAVARGAETSATRGSALSGNRT